MTANDVYARTGIMAELGRFRVVSSRRYARDSQVICRTERGLEIATIVCEAPSNATDVVRGDILRSVTPNDLLILDRLERHRLRALEACQRLIDERGLPSILVDVEHLFDGESLYFQFLGEVDTATQELLNELAATYEKRVGFRQFVDRLANGCGPGCGTTASRCGTSCPQCPAGGCGSLR